MPFRYRDALDQNALKARICERLLAVGSLEAVCREAGAPHRETVRRWARDDVSFAEALKLARRKGWFARKWAFDDAQAKRVLAHLATGGTIRLLPKGPGWPSVRRVQYWRTIDGEFGADVLRLQAVRRGNRGAPLGRRAKAFDRAIADRVIVAVGRGAHVARLADVDPTLPGRGLIRRWRREDKDFASGLAFAIRVSRARRRREPAMLTPWLRQEVIDRIREGASLSSLGEEQGMPCKATFYAWIRRSPEFAREVMAACDDREDWWADQIGEAMEAAVAVGTMKALREATAPLNRQWARHQHRPGRKWR